MLDIENMQNQFLQQKLEKYNPDIETKTIIEHYTDSLGNKKSRTYLKEKYLGKGGFAYCMQVLELNKPSDGTRFAMKIMPKIMNGKPRSKAKIKNEVSVLKEMDHPNVVKLHRVFEDEKNVYMAMELCENNSLIELLKGRRRLTEIEVRCYMTQLIQGIIHIHEKKIVHRDLKLGNLFLNRSMQLKIGDFGLSERIQYEGEKLSSVSGTPNYIAPEILLKKDGHSYEVDIWAMGVIAYTLLVGIPPFQSKTSKATCSRIKQALYTFPETLKLDISTKEFIKDCLQLDPKKRIKLNDMLNHQFFSFTYPSLLCISTLYSAPTDIYEERRVSTCTPQLVNFNRARSVAQMRNIPNVVVSLKENTDEDFAKDFNEKILIEESSPLDTKMKTFKGLKPTIFSSIKNQQQIQDKNQFSTKMAADYKHERYHPKDSIDIPKVEISNSITLSNKNKSSSFKKNLQYTVVTKYMNLPERCGIGYQLSNNDIGIMCNDGSKVLLKPDFDKLFYFNEHDVLIYSEAYSTIKKLSVSNKSNERIKSSSSNCRCVEEVCICPSRLIQSGDIQITAYRTKRFCDTSEFKKKLALIEICIESLKLTTTRKVWNEYQSSNDPYRTIFIK